MTEKTLKNVIRKSVLTAEGYCTVGFQGGEPTLCGLDFFKTVIRYVDHYKKNGIQIYYVLQTNGYGITKEWCQFFSEHHFLIGLSVDGTKEIHDRYRHSAAGHKDIFDRVYETSKLFDQYHVDYNILTVVHRETATHIKEIYAEYKKCGFKWLQFITCLDPLGEERGKEEYSLPPEVYGRFLIDLFELWYRDFLVGKQPYIRLLENHVNIIAGGEPESCENRGVCGIQTVVEADGSVYPCDFMPLMNIYLAISIQTL